MLTQASLMVLVTVRKMMIVMTVELLYKPHTIGSSIESAVSTIHHHPICMVV